MHRRKNIKLSYYDYRSSGAYFITICTNNRRHFLGKIAQGKMRLSEIGWWAWKCWYEIPEHFPEVELDEFVVMPNHVHGILWITKFVGAQNVVPLRHQFQKIIPRSIATIVRGFKIGVTKMARLQIPNMKIWQRSYYDRIIRDEEELNAIRTYIRRNPRKWSEDAENR